MDIEIAVDMMEMGSKVDHIVLFSGDGDFRRLIEAVQREGVRVSVVSTLRTSTPKVADELRRQTDAFIELQDLAPQIARTAPPDGRSHIRRRRRSPGMPPDEPAGRPPSEAASPESPRSRLPRRARVPASGLPDGHAPGADSEGKTLTIPRSISYSGRIGSCERLMVEGTVETEIHGCRVLTVAARGVFRGSADVERADIRRHRGGTPDRPRAPHGAGLGTDPLRVALLRRARNRTGRERSPARFGPVRRRRNSRPLPTRPSPRARQDCRLRAPRR